MLLYTLSFIALFAVIFFLYWKLPKQFQWIMLLGFGYFFYGSSQPAYLALILLTTIVSYYAAIMMGKKPKQKGRFLLLVLVFSLGILFIFKYFNFFAVNISHVWPVPLPKFDMLLPLGISFYTLQVVGYLIDVYKNKIKPEKHLGHFALFVCFFPQLSAGPIERGNTLLPQLKKAHTFQYAEVAEGVKLFAFGLFKKMVIADNLAVVVDRGFDGLPDYKGVSLLIIILLYTWQIYMDFSGYTDMARGVAKMLGITLLKNFNVPYTAKSIQDFWRRWHMSFSSWLRDYIYFPLGGSRKGLPRTVINTIAVFILSGLWHGAAWTFVIWGVLHGVAIAVERIVKQFFGGMIRIPSILQIAYAYCLVSIFWVFFRAPTVQDAIYVLRNALVGIKNIFSPDYLMASLNQLFVFNKAEMVITFGLLLIAIALEIIQSKNHLVQLFQRQPAVVRYVVYAIMLAMIFQLRNAEVKEFIYVRF